MPSEGFRKVIRRRIRRKRPGLDVSADVNTVIAVNTGKHQTTKVSSKVRTRKGVNTDG